MKRYGMGNRCVRVRIRVRVRGVRVRVSVRVMVRIRVRVIVRVRARIREIVVFTGKKGVIKLTLYRVYLINRIRNYRIFCLTLLLPVIHLAGHIWNHFKLAITHY